MPEGLEKKLRSETVREVEKHILAADAISHSQDLKNDKASGVSVVVDPYNPKHLTGVSLSNGLYHQIFLTTTQLPLDIERTGRYSLWRWNI